MKRKMTLREWREYRHMTRNEVGEKIGFSAAAISMWERGTASIKYENLKKLMEVYEIEDSSDIELPGLAFWGRSTVK